MKKKALLITTLFFGMNLAAFSQNPGDVNGNGTIDIVDALSVAQYYVGLTPPVFYPAYADVDGSGSITIIDALLIAQYYVGLIDEFPVQTPPPTSTPPPSSSYDDFILAAAPVAYWPLTPGNPQDIAGHNLDGTFAGNPTTSTLPNGDTVSVFNGQDQYFEAADNPLLELTRTGILTIEAWMRPDVLNFPIATGTGPYVHWMGKGEAEQHSWVARIYNYDSHRPNRISGYSFNLSGGLGAGSYFQDLLTAGHWIHYTLNINVHTGLTRIFKNGFLRDTDYLSDYSIQPGDGTAPIRVGTRSLESFFQGAIGKVAIYDYELTEQQLLQHNNLMRGLPLDLVAGENFDTESAGSRPLNFTLSLTAGTSALVSAAASASAPHSLHLSDTDTGGYIRATKYFSASENPTIEMKIKSPGEKLDISILDTNYVARLYFREDGTLAYYHTSFEAVANYDTAGWNTLRVIFNGSNQTYNLELNGAVVATAIPYYTTAATVNTLRLNTGSTETAHGIYLDDISVSE